MYEFKWLQMFADGGAGDGGTAGAAQTGETAAAAAQQNEETVADRLRRKGVPESKLSRRAYQQKASARSSAPDPVPDAEGQAAAAEPKADGKAQSAPAETRKPSFDELMQDPDYNTAMQQVVQKRLSKSKAAEKRLDALTPTLQKIARRYGLAEDFTPEQLAELVDNDDSYYEQQAMEMGVTPDVARRLDEANMILAQRDRDRIAQEKAAEQDNKLRETFARLQGEAAELKKKYPGFDFGKELENPQFAFMLQPGSGLNLEQAYFAIHRNEILEAERKSYEARVSATLQANRARPRETAKTQTATSTTNAIDWSKASREQREALKKRILSGERVLPGQGFI